MEASFILVDHNEFNAFDFAELQASMRRPMIFDTRNIVKANGEDVAVVNYGNPHIFKNKTTVRI
nr:UDP binding domain-containing protein [Exiguobacterium algae]